MCFVLSKTVLNNNLINGFHTYLLIQQQIIISIWISIVNNRLLRCMIIDAKERYNLINFYQKKKKILDSIKGWRNS